MKWKSIASFFLFLSIFFAFDKHADGQGWKEWLIYFHRPSDYRQFFQMYKDRIEESENNLVVKARFRDEEINTIRKLPIVSNVEPNYQKKLADLVSFNDPFFFQQWGLRDIDAEEVLPRQQEQNLLLGKEVVTANGGSTYEGQPISGSTVTFSLPNEKMTRLSVVLDHVEGNWGIEVQDGQGNRLAENEGTIAQLDVLLPKNRLYTTIRIVVKNVESWHTPPIIRQITAVNHVLVAVIDTGVSFHEDFCGNILHSLGKDYVNGGGMAIDENGHGTHVAGIIASCPNNRKGIVGVAGTAIDVLPLKALDAQGTGDDFDIAQAVDDAVALGADVINFSLAGQGKTLVLEQAIMNALAHDVTVVAAAGNWGTSLEGIYPASYPGVITVGAVNETNDILPYSDYGWELDVSAPGANIVSTFLNNGYKSLSGTSMATPFVTSEVALLKAAYPQLDMVQIRKRLFQTAVDIREKGFDPYSGYGIIQLAKALQLPEQEALDWWTLKDGQPLDSSQAHLLGLSHGLFEKNVYIWMEDQLIWKGKGSKSPISVQLSNSQTGRQEKTVTVLAADVMGNVLAEDERRVETNGKDLSSFSDVSETFWASKEIQKAYIEKWVNGFTDGSFRPNDSLERRHAVMMMDRLFHWPIPQIRSPFTDTPLEMAGSLAVYSAYHEQVIKGYENGNFYPESFLTRAQMAVMLARALHLDEHSFSGTPYLFQDLSSPNQFAYYAVQQLTEKGIITKQPYFRPNERLTRAQFAALLVRTYNYLQNEATR